MLCVSFTKLVGSFHFGQGSLKQLNKVVESKKSKGSNRAVYLIDHYFKEKNLPSTLTISQDDLVIYIDSSDEPTTDGVDSLKEKVVSSITKEEIKIIIGIGGGATLDSAKALSNLITNEGPAENYQGWDLVKNPGVYKVGVPTLSGTGAEASRTCVLTNKKKNLKLGMNSHHTVFDHLIMDPSLTKTVDRDQFFYTAMDTYIHCIESLNGSFRHPFADGFSHEALRLIKEVMLSSDMMTDENRSKVMTASYLGGSAVGNSFVGIIHPLSAGLGTVYGSKHCISNCIVMQQMEEFYPKEYNEFIEMKERQGIKVPSNVTANVTEDELVKLYESSTVHEKPLQNALGPDFRKVLTLEKVSKIYKKM
jgi:3-deoxy-alpha-D-manno-octulosonate 8-oxidase